MLIKQLPFIIDIWSEINDSQEIGFPILLVIWDPNASHAISRGDKGVVLLGRWNFWCKYYTV